jgi:anti-anti-sigma factor
MTGEIDMAAEGELTQVRRSVDALLAARASDGRDCPLDWAVDVGDVTFMDSTGLGFLAHLHRVLAEAGGTVTLVRPGPILLRTLSIVHLDEVLEIAGEDVREQTP